MMSRYRKTYEANGITVYKANGITIYKANGITIYDMPPEKKKPKPRQHIVAVKGDYYSYKPAPSIAHKNEQTRNFTR